MAATTAMAERLRRMVDEPTEATYDDDLIDTYIETYPLLDALGTGPQDVDYSTTPPTITELDEWIPTYDLHAAAADIWLEKAAAIADEFTFKADGGSYSRSDKVKHYKSQAQFHLSRRSAKTITLWVEPREVHSQEEV